jgi:cytochrome P450
MTAPVFDFDMYDDARMDDDVQAAYARALRDAPDIFYTPRNGGHWVMRRYAPIADLLRDYEHFSAREMRIPRIPDPPLLLPLMVDPPHSAAYRQAMMPTFSPKGIRALQPKVEAWAARIVGEVAAAGECDFVNDVATPLPISVFMELMGLPLERLREFRALGGSFFKVRDTETLMSISAQIQAILAERIEACRVAPGDDLVSALVAAEVDGRRVTTEEVMAMCFLLFLGGMDTVTNLTSFAFRRLAGDPALQQRLRADPTLIPRFTEESLRFFSVVNPSRLVIRDCDRFGVPMKAGEMVLCLLSEAGRDDRVNPDPHRFDVDREGAVHLSFATGPHLCVGHILARAEIQALTAEWLRQVPSFAVKPGARYGFRMGVVAALESLPLVWDA